MTPAINGHNRISQLQADLEQVEQSLRLSVAPNGLGEIRVIGQSGGPYGYYFGYDQIPQAVRIAARDTQTAKGVYFVFNELSAQLGDRPRLTRTYTLTKDVDIARRRLVLIDLDPSSAERGPEDSSTDMEKEAARETMELVYEWLRSQGFPEPIVADSGNGWHLLFAVDLPNDDQTTDLIQAFVNALAKRFSTADVAVDISVFNSSRITKLYGTVSRKGENRLDRPHRLSRIISVPDGSLQPVARELFDAVTGADGLFNRAESLVERSPPTRSAPKLILPEVFPVGGRHKTLLSVAGAARAIGSHESEILEILRIFNRTRCADAKPDAELQQIARDYALKDVNLGMQALMTCDTAAGIEQAQRQQRLRHGVQNIAKRMGEGATEAELAIKLSSILAELEQGAEAIDFETLSSQDLDAGQFSLDYAIAGILVERQPCILGGPKKCLKTNVLIALVLALSSGCKFLGEFFVSRTYRIALISGESGKATIQETARRIAKASLWPHLRDYENAFWCFSLPKLGQPDTVRTLISYIQKHRLEILILDPIYLCMPIGDAASNLFLVGQMLSDLNKVMDETGCTIILCHHSKKGTGANQFDPPELESMAWAGFQEWARQWILLGRRAPYAPDSGGYHELWLATGGSAGHSGLWALDVTEGTREDPQGRCWDVIVRKASEARQAEAQEREAVKDQRDQQHRNSDREKVLKAYALFPLGETSRCLRDSAGLSGTKFGPVNADLIRDGIVESCTITKGGKRHEAFRLKGVGQPGLVPLNPTGPAEPRSEWDKPLSLKRGCPSPTHPRPSDQGGDVLPDSIDVR